MTAPLRLRDLDHPDMSEWLVHFTGRPRTRKDLSAEIKAASPSERLESVLRGRTLTAFRTFYAPVPVVCFTESTLRGLEYMIGQAQFSPWGLVFHRQTVYERGGGPVFHLREEYWDHRQSLPEEVQAMIVKFAAGEAEWVEEREWRIAYSDGDGFSFDTDEIEAVIVGDPNWPPDEVEMEYGWTGDDIDWHPVSVPAPWFAGITRWAWDGDHSRLVVLD